MNTKTELTATPEVKAGMGIHRSPRDVFNAFVDPSLTRRFWINDSTGSLAPGASVTWDLTSDGAQAEVVVRQFEPGERLVFDWGDGNDMTTVDFEFSPWRTDGCYVTVTETGFTGDADQLAAHAADSTGGFTMALCSLKALLDHDIELGAVHDRLPDS